MNRRFCIIIGLIIPLLWCIPVYFGYSTETENGDLSREFLGWIRSDDFHRYGSFIDQTRYLNRIIYEDFSSVETQSPRMIAIYFTTLGVLGKIIAVKAETLWLLSKLLVGWFFVFCLLGFLKKWSKNQKEITWALFLVLFSSGFEFLAGKLGQAFPRPKNFWMDGFSTFCSFHNPLKLMGIACVLLLYICLDEYLKKKKPAYLSAAGLLILILWGLHPNSAIVGYSGVFALALLLPSYESGITAYFNRWKRLFLLSVPVILILLYIKWMQSDPTTANIIKQYSLKFLTEPYKFYLIRYGLLIPLGIYGFAITVKDSRSDMDIMLLGWWLGGEIFAHFAQMSGLLFQHMIHLPLAIFSARALVRLVESRKQIEMFFGFMLSILFLYQGILTIHQVSEQTKSDVWPTSLYWTRGEIEMAHHLRQMDDGNVLVTRNSGNKVGWLSLKNVLLGHWGTTPEKGKKEKEVKRFFDLSTPFSAKIDLLTQYEIQYIWYGPDEKEIGRIDNRLNIEIIEKNDSVTLYKVRD